MYSRSIRFAEKCGANSAMLARTRAKLELLVNALELADGICYELLVSHVTDVLMRNLFALGLERLVHLNKRVEYIRLQFTLVRQLQAVVSRQLGPEPHGGRKDAQRITHHMDKSGSWKQSPKVPDAGRVSGRFQYQAQAVPAHHHAPEECDKCPVPVLPRFRRKVAQRQEPRALW